MSHFSFRSVQQEGKNVTLGTSASNLFHPSSSKRTLPFIFSLILPLLHFYSINEIDKYEENMNFRQSCERVTVVAFNKTNKLHYTKKQVEETNLLLRSTTSQGSSHLLLLCLLLYPMRQIIVWRDKSIKIRINRKEVSRWNIEQHNSLYKVQR